MTLRADGRENRLRLLEAAEAVFAEQGFEAPLEAVAARAGVSRMTLYRRFRDRETLCLAVLERNVTLLELQTSELAEDPDACLTIIDMMTVMFTTNQAMVDGLSRQTEHRLQVDGLRRRVVDLLAGPLRRGQEAGLIKAGIAKEDLALVIFMLGGAVGDGPLEERSARVRRAQEILKHGFLCDSGGAERKLMRR